MKEKETKKEEGDGKKRRRKEGNTQKLNYLRPVEWAELILILTQANPIRKKNHMKY